MSRRIGESRGVYEEHDAAPRGERDVVVGHGLARAGEGAPSLLAESDAGDRQRARRRF